MTIENPPALIVRKPHVLCSNDDARVALELAIARVGHPVSFER
jgi:hypothetical protein